MLSNTLAMFRNSNDEGLSPSEGVLLIDGWQQALQGDPNLDQIKGLLDELRTAIQAHQPDKTYIRDLLHGLADKTEAIASDSNSEGTWTGGLESLSKILRGLIS
ncbi:hypothetical protein GCM10028807_01270 [Spirosoma daeguense]